MKLDILHNRSSPQSLTAQLVTARDTQVDKLFPA
jgi:hypothetical protein